MKKSICLYLKLIISLNLIFFCFNVFAQNTKKNFVINFHLIKKENYYLPTKKTNLIISRINSINEPAKIFLIKNDFLEEKNLLLFYIQSQDTCHACGVELWLYSLNKKPSIVQLIKNTGNSGEPPSLLETIIKDKNLYLLFKSTFMGQGIAESSLELIQYKLESPVAKKVYFSYLSDTSFVDHDPNCTGWSTTYEVNTDRITFDKNGYSCDVSFEKTKSRNLIKIQKKNYYKFEDVDIE